MRLRSVASLVLVALIAGVIAARTDSGSAPRPARAPVARVVPAPATRPFLAAPAAVVYGCAAPVALDPRRRTSQAAPKPPAATPPSQALLDAFAILRRPRTDQDALPPEAVAALRARGSSLDQMAAPRALVVLTLLAVTVAAVSVSILAWIAIATASHTQRVVDKADRVADDAALSIRRLDRTTRELDPAVRSLRRAADALSEARAAP